MRDYKPSGNKTESNDQFAEMCGVFFPVFKKISATDVYSITLGGSNGKGVSDVGSDYDFRIFYEQRAGPDEMRQIMPEVGRLCAEWKNKYGVAVDGVFARSFAEIDAQLDSWLSGDGRMYQYEWTIWGYCVLTDIYNQIIIEDPYGKAAAWRERLSVYPEALKTSILRKHVSSLEYWKDDYHYRNKVNRKDAVFLASAAVRLINDIIQVIYALNEFYYPGDGMNLLFTRNFEKKPADFEERAAEIFRIPGAPSDAGAGVCACCGGEAADAYKKQYDSLMELTADTLALVDKTRLADGVKDPFAVS